MTQQNGSLIQELKDFKILPENYVLSRPSGKPISGGHYEFNAYFENYFEYVNIMGKLGNGYAASEEDYWDHLGSFKWYRYYPGKLLLMRTQHYGAASLSEKWTKKVSCKGYMPQSQIGYVLTLLCYNVFPYGHRREFDPLTDRLFSLINGKVDSSEMGKSLYEFTPQMLQLHHPGMFGDILNVSIEELKLEYDMNRLALQ